LRHQRVQQQQQQQQPLTTTILRGNVGKQSIAVSPTRVHSSTARLCC
jgi:hypothetical protein